MPQEQLDRYLRRATRGLCGRRRREVREELETHLQDRIRAYRIAGLSEGDATEQTLKELGHPKEVSRGMAQLYALPPLIGSGTLLAALCVLFVIALPEGVAQSLEVSYRHPSSGCLERNRGCDSIFEWTNAEALRNALEPQGGAVRETATGGLLLDLPGARSVYLSLGPTVYQTDYEGAPLSADRKSSPDYYTLDHLISAMAAQAGKPVRLEGWEAPVLSVGDTKFDLVGQEKALSSRSLYLRYLVNVLSSLIEPSPGVRSAAMYGEPVGITFATAPGAARSHSMTYRVPEPGVYGLIVARDPAVTTAAEGVDIVLNLDVAPANEEGIVTFPNKVAGPLNFVMQERDFARADALQPGDAILLHLTGEYRSAGRVGYEFVSPQSVQDTQ